MDASEFQDTNATYVVTVFIGEAKLKEIEDNLTLIDRMDHVLMVVQPCPEEAITFLHHISNDLPGRLKGTDTDFYWEGFKLKKATPEKIAKKILHTHHEHLMAILSQEVELVGRSKMALISYEEHFLE